MVAVTTANKKTRSKPIFFDLVAVDTGLLMTDIQLGAAINKNCRPTILSRVFIYTALSTNGTAGKQEMPSMRRKRQTLVETKAVFTMCQK